jgi:hypothetical protein
MCNQKLIEDASTDLTRVVRTVMRSHAVWRYARGVLLWSIEKIITIIIAVKFMFKSFKFLSEILF